MSEKQLVLIDNCMTNRFTDHGIDPVEDLKNTEFQLAYTPDLKKEYEMALDVERTPVVVKELIRKILATGSLYGFFGFSELGKGDEGPCLGFDRGVWVDKDQSDWINRETKDNEAGKKVKNTEVGLPPKPRKRTDFHLVAMAKYKIVITDNHKEGHWRRLLHGDGRVTQWKDFEGVLFKEKNLAAAIRRESRISAGKQRK